MVPSFVLLALLWGSICCPLSNPEKRSGLHQFRASGEGKKER